MTEKLSLAHACRRVLWSKYGHSKKSLDEVERCSMVERPVADTPLKFAIQQLCYY